MIVYLLFVQKILTLLNSFWKRFFCFFFPKWKHRTTEDILLIRQPVSVALAMEILGCAPQNPWVYIGGNATAILVDSEFAKDYYVRSGIDERKIRIVGNIPNEHSKKLIMEHAVSCNNKVVSEKKVLCSLPPDMIDRLLFTSHREMTEYWIKSLKKPGVNLIVSLHPRLPRNDFSFVEKKYNIQISEIPINELIAECDIFVACISATIRTALAYKKVVLNFDMFKFNYSDYNNIPMVLTVTTKEDFLRHYDQLINDDKYINELKGLYNNYPAKYFGFNNDGIVRNIYSLLS